jgi:acyl-CoA synthetase (AMP-forming)/AMP-acid ligase II
MTDPSLIPQPTTSTIPTPTVILKSNLSKYGNTTMTKTFQNVEPIPIPRIIGQDATTLEELAGRQMLPSLPRDIPFKLVDPDKQDPTLFHTISELLRYRANNSQGRIMPAFTQVDDKGKESISVTWEKLAGRAEKVAMVIRDKSGLQVGDCVALLYRKSEIVDFIVALLGCFIAGMVAVPINAIEELSELWFILRVSNVHLVITTDINLKTLTKNMKTRNADFPKNVDWWPSNDFGSLYPYQIKSGKYNALRSTPLAYIEYTKSMNGELKGVAVSHQSIMRSCHSYTAATTETVVFTAEDGVTSVLPNWDTQGTDTLLSYLEPRQQLGLNVSVLCSIYSGSHTIFASANIMETPTVWIHVISKYKGKYSTLLEHDR